MPHNALMSTESPDMFTVTASISLYWPSKQRCSGRTLLCSSSPHPLPSGIWGEWWRHARARATVSTSVQRLISAATASINTTDRDLLITFNNWDGFSREQEESSFKHSPNSNPKQTEETKSLFECNKVESDRTRQQTRINIGAAFEPWKTLRAALGMKKDQPLASLLLER